MKYTNTKTEKRMRRRRRIRARISGTASIPRLAVYKSLRYMYAQLIDDENAVTLAASSSYAAKKGKKKGETKVMAAEAIGSEIAKMAKEKGITKVVFDRGGFIYTGRVKALAESARKAGLQF